MRVRVRIRIEDKECKRLKKEDFLKNSEPLYIGMRYITEFKYLELFNMLGGGTNFEKALLYAHEDILVFCAKNHMKGCMLVFSDGEPTRGLRGQELKSLSYGFGAKYLNIFMCIK